MRSLLRWLCVLFLFSLGATYVGEAQSAGKENFPVVFGPNNAGRDFWLAFPANWDYSAPQKYVRLYITAGTRTRVNVWAGSTLVKSIFTIPYDVVTVDLTIEQAQMFTRDDRAPVPDDQVYFGRAVHVEAEAPIVVYGINRITYTSDGLLALPTNGLGREYIIASAADIVSGNNGQKLPSQFMVTAPYDNTIVSIVQSWDSYGHNAGQTYTVTLNKGDVYSVMSKGIGGDLSGTYISASRPIAVTAGQNCTYLPDYQYPACDHICEMMLPISSWGKFYHSMPYALRLKGDMYRIFAGEPNAKIYINGTLYGTLNQVGGVEGIGWLQYLPPNRERIEFTSDKRIYVAQYNNSQQYDGILTDPFYLVLTPVEQYQTELVFCTPSSDYPQNFINLACDSAAYEQIEIAQGGTNNWQKIRTMISSPIRVYPTKLNGMPYYGVTFEIKPGTYRLRGPRPFAGYIYGYSNYDSYGYPLSVAVGNLQLKDSIAPVVDKKVDCDGNVDATTTDYPEDSRVRANLSTVELHPNSFNYQLTVTPFVPAETQSTKYRLQVVDPTQDAMAIVVVIDAASNVTLDTVNYAAFDVVMGPYFKDFNEGIPSFTVGSPATRRLVTLTNKASRRVDIKQTKLKFGNQNFTIISPVGPFTLIPNETKDVTIEFTPVAAGVFQDSIVVEDTCGPHTIGWVRAKVGTPMIDVSDIDFGTWPISAGVKPGTWQFQIRNKSTDDGDLTVTGVVSGPTNAVFTLPNGLPAFPLTLPAGGFRDVQVSFDPAAVQTYSDQIVFSHNAPPNPGNDSIAVLTGEGVQATLVATDWNFGRRRAARNPMPSCATPAEYTDIVTLQNLGNSPVTIRDTASVSGDRGAFRIVDIRLVQNATINPGGKIDLPVMFTPPDTGVYRLTIDFDDNDASTTVTSTLTGIGVVPALATDSLDFGSMNPSDPERTLTVTFRLDRARYGQYVDTTTIDNFTFTSDQFGGQNDFRFDPITTPIVLIPGETEVVTVTGYFQARTTGFRAAHLLAETNCRDEVDTISHWIGNGLGAPPPVVPITGVDASITCADDGDELIITITNPNQTAIRVDSLRLGSATGNFDIVSPAPNVPFQLSGNATQQIRVRYTNRGGSSTEVLSVYNTSGVPSDTLDVNLSATPAVATTTSVILTGSKGAKAELGFPMTAAVELNESMAAANVTDYTVTLTYDSKLLMPRTGEIKLGAANPAGSTFTFDNSTAGIVTINVTSPSPITGIGELVSMPFGVAFGGELARTVSATVTVPSTVSCLTIAPSTSTIPVEPICGLTVRLIEMTSSKYALYQNSPNPFNPTTKIAYSLGLDGQTQLMLFDAKGQMIQTLLNEYQQPGTYEITLDVMDLPSGTYYYRLVSGDWSETMRMNVVK